VKIMTVLGSPKKGGNTAAALAMFEKLVAEGHEVERVNIADMNFTGCQGCYSCQQNADEPSCILSDDASDVYRRILGCDAIVYAAPLYMWGFPSGIHGFMERHLSLVTGYGTPGYKSLVKGKRTALLMTCGGPVENNADLVQGVFERFADYAQAENVGAFIVAGATTPDEIEAKAEGVVAEMAKAIVA
jgi:multimeric flavodoxin WrbA